MLLYLLDGCKLHCPPQFSFHHFLFVWPGCSLKNARYVRLNSLSLLHDVIEIDILFTVLVLIFYSDGIYDPYP